MLFSQDDEPYPPSERLIKLAVQLIGLANASSLEEIAADRPTAPPYFAAWPGEHYILLAGTPPSQTEYHVLSALERHGHCGMETIAGRQISL